MHLLREMQVPPFQCGLRIRGAVVVAVVCRRRRRGEVWGSTVDGRLGVQVSRSIRGRDGDGGDGGDAEEFNVDIMAFDHAVVSERSGVVVNEEQPSLLPYLVPKPKPRRRGG